MKTVLYIHGMGGGADSRIPALLSAALSDEGVRVVCRTYDFDPDKAAPVIRGWFGELSPDLVVGESLGACHAARLTGVPKVYVSPAFKGCRMFGRLAFLAGIPKVRAALTASHPVCEGDRQSLDFYPETLMHYRRHYREAMRSAAGETAVSFAFFGTRDSYRRSGIVSLRHWERRFGGDRHCIYDGVHCMEEQHVQSLLVPKILQILNNVSSTNCN